MSAFCIDAASLTEVGHISTSTAATLYSYQPKPESQSNQQWDAGGTSPAPNRWDMLLNELADVLTEPTQLHPRPIKHCVELLDQTKPIPNHKQCYLKQKELE